MNLKTITPADIATAIGFSEKQTWSFARRMDDMFRPTRLQQIGKKCRPIDAPKPDAKKTLRKLHRWFQSQKLFHNAAYGSVKGRSCFKSAERHLGRKFVWTRDAADCYPSVTPVAFLRELKRLGFQHRTAVLLTKLCTLRGRIAQGSPVSGDALNIFFWRLDQFISSLCGSAQQSYSRVADDFVIGGKNKDTGDNTIRRLECELANRGMKINDKKRRESGLQTREKPKLVHNIRVDFRSGTKISREHHAEAIRVAESYVAGCRSAQPDTIEALAIKRQVLSGWLNYAKQATHAPVKHLSSHLKLGDRLICRRLDSVRLSPYKKKWWVVSRKRNEPKRLAHLWRCRTE